MIVSTKDVGMLWHHQLLERIMGSFLMESALDSLSTAISYNIIHNCLFVCLVAMNLSCASCLVYHLARIYMASHHVTVTSTWHFNYSDCYKNGKWSYKSKKRTGHVFYMATPSHATESVCLLLSCQVYHKASQSSMRQCIELYIRNLVTLIYDLVVPSCWQVKLDIEGKLIDKHVTGVLRLLVHAKLCPIGKSISL